MPFRNPSARAVTPGGRGRFPGFDVLDQVGSLGRGHRRRGARPAGPPPSSFFTDAEQATAGAAVRPAPRTSEEPQGAGARPRRPPARPRPDRRLALRGPARGRHRHGADPGRLWTRMPATGHGAALPRLDAEAAGRTGPGGAGRRSSGTGSPAPMSGSLWTRYACTAFYSHPWAWNEIGFGGPAYPRGYQALGVGKLEHWEVPTTAQCDPVHIRRSHRAGQARHDRTGERTTVT